MIISAFILCNNVQAYDIFQKFFVKPKYMPQSKMHAPRYLLKRQARHVSQDEQCLSCRFDNVTQDEFGKPPLLVEKLFFEFFKFAFLLDDTQCKFLDAEFNFGGMRQAVKDGRDVLYAQAQRLQMTLKVTDLFAKFTDDV